MSALGVKRTSTGPFGCFFGEQRRREAAFEHGQNLLADLLANY
jgi:hypothetical protein